MTPPFADFLSPAHFPGGQAGVVAALVLGAFVLATLVLWLAAKLLRVENAGFWDAVGVVVLTAVAAGALKAFTALDLEVLGGLTLLLFLVGIQLIHETSFVRALGCFVLVLLAQGAVGTALWQRSPTFQRLLRPPAGEARLAPLPDPSPAATPAATIPEDPPVASVEPVVGTAPEAPRVPTPDPPPDPPPSSPARSDPPPPDPQPPEAPDLTPVAEPLPPPPAPATRTPSPAAADPWGPQLVGKRLPKLEARDGYGARRTLADFHGATALWLTFTSRGAPGTAAFEAVAARLQALLDGRVTFVSAYDLGGLGGSAAEDALVSLAMNAGRDAGLLLALRASDFPAGTPGRRRMRHLVVDPGGRVMAVFDGEPDEAAVRRRLGRLAED